MKKLIAMLLAVMMVVCCLTACQKNDTPATTEPTDTQNTEGTEGTEPAEESDFDYIAEKGVLVVGITDFAPMDFKDENGEWTGFDAEFAKLFAAELGIEVEFFEVDWDNKFMELDTKKIDCIWNGMTITEEVTLNTSCSNAYAMNAQVVVMKADKVADFADVESMKDLIFAVEAGSAGEEALEGCGITNTVRKQTQADALLEVKSGTADAAVIDITMAKAMTGEGTSYADLACGIELTSEEYGVSFRKGSDMLDVFNAYMAMIMSDGTLDALAEQYGIALVK